MDYSQFFSFAKWEMKCNCRARRCRKVIGFGLETDLELEKFWEANLKSALEFFFKVPQPIFRFNDKYAIEITRIIKSMKRPVLGKYVKFSLIEGSESNK